MPTPPLSDEAAAEALRAYKKAGTYTGAGDLLGLNEATVRRRIKTAVARGFDPDNPPAGFEVARVTTTEDRDGNVRSRSISSRPERGPVVVDPSKPFRGTVHVDSEGRLIQAWPRPAGPPGPEEWLTAICEAVKETAPQPTPPPPTATVAGRINVIPYFDAHFGGRSWGKETGEDYDLTIAEQAVDDVSERVHAGLPSAETALVVWGGDNLHARDDTWQTPANRHILQGDDRIFKVARTALRAMKRTVLRALRSHQRVDVVIHRGNHDEESARMLGLALIEAFAHDERVTIYVPEGHFFFKRYGTNLIATAHGDTAKLKDMPLLLAVERPDDWAKANTRHAIVGHFHKARLEDIQSVWCMVSPPLAARDAYAASHGWHSIRGVKALTYDLADGYEGETFRRIRYEAKATA